MNVNGLTEIQKLKASIANWKKQCDIYQTAYDEKVQRVAELEYVIHKFQSEQKANTKYMGDWCIDCTHLHNYSPTYNKHKDKEIYCDLRVPCKSFNLKGDK